MNNNNTTKRTLKESTKKIVAFNQNYLCKECNSILPPSFQIDHIIPFSLSQDDEDENLQALCPNCHSLKTQRENMRISHFKKMYNIIENCWFCLEKNCNNTCSKILQKIDTNNKTKYDNTTFEDLCNKLRYDEHKNSLKIEVCLYNCCIYVNNVICRMNKYDITVDDIVDAVFLATRSKKYNLLYNEISIKIIPPNSYNKDDLETCVNFIENTITLDDFPERILKPDNFILLLCHS